MTTQPHVLVVDDERFFRESIRDALAPLPVRCVLAESGEEALKLAEDPAIGAVVLDVRLPGLSGLDVLAHLRADHPHLHVIVFSAQTDQEQVLEALRLGATDYLAKPIHEEELRLAVTRAVDGTALARSWDSLSSRLAHLANCEASLEALGFELQVLARPTVQALSELLGAARTSLVVGADGGEALRIVASVGSELPPQELAQTRTVESVAGLALGADDVLRIDDIDRDARCSGRVRYGQYAGRAALLAPVTVDGQAYGVLCAADRVAGGVFDDQEVALIRLLAAHLGARLSGSGLARNEASDSGRDPDYPGGPEEAARVELALALGAAITDEVEPEALMSRALATIADSLDALTSIHLIDATSGRLRLEAQHEHGARSDRAELEVGAGLTSLVLQTGRLVAAETPESDPRFVADIDTPLDAARGPLLCLPLSVRGKVLGVARIFPELGEVASARTGELLAVSLSAAIRTVLLYRNLLEAIDDVARARRNSGAGSG
jgi:DNA-binding response OmpR family regulator